MFIMSEARVPSQSRSDAGVSSVNRPNNSSSLISWIWSTISPMIWRISIMYMKIFMLLASLGVFVITTIILYSLIYWMVIPKRLHSYPVYFDYTNGNEVVCSTVVMSGERQWETASRPIHQWDKPTGGFDFDVTLTLDFPTNHHNKNLGPVMFETKIFSSHTELVSTRRPFLIPHISSLAQLFRDAIYMSLAGLYLVTDKLSAEVELVESMPVFLHEPLSKVLICMYSPNIHVYSGQLNFVSKLSGIRYLIAHHPIFVGLIVVGVVLGMAMFGMVMAAIIRYVRSNGEDEWVEGSPDLSPVSRPSSGGPGDEAEDHIPRRSRSHMSDSNLRKRA